MSFLGKVFLLAALAGYSYLLMTDVSLGKQFDGKFKEFTNQSIVKQYVPQEYIKLVPVLLARQIISGLIASSALMFLCGWFALFPIFGILLNVAIAHNPYFQKDPQTQIEFLKFLALIGGLLLWAASSCKKQCVQAPTKVKQA